MITIDMPKNYRYMSQYKDRLLGGLLPLDSKFILNKTVPGCGGTSMFLESDLPIVLISPRIQVLKEKHNYYTHNGLETFLFYTPFTNAEKRTNEIATMMGDLNSYIIERISPRPFGKAFQIPKILVTLDSAVKVLDVLERMNIQNNFLYIVDEFQCLLGDASFKGSTDMSFLMQIDQRVQKICYLSATPIKYEYLEQIPQFKNIPYYQLVWDPDVLVEPTLRELKMKKGDSAEKICQSIISDFRRNGYFARKIMPDGCTVYSNEVCIFLNELKSIKNIISKNRLKPEEVSILCSEGRTSELPKGFTIGNMTIDKNNPQNKPFTFCTKASFEGVDFYSTNAITYIFIDGGKTWQALDILIDIPQILGRQRLDINPFKYDATIYYKTKPCVESDEEFANEQKMMTNESYKIMSMFNNAAPEMKEFMVKSYIEKKLDAKFKDDYIDVLTDANGTTIGINSLVAISRWNQWLQRKFYYSNSFQLMKTIQSAIQMRIKPGNLKSFENKFYNCPPSKQLELYANFRNHNPELYSFLIQNPFIMNEYHLWFDNLGFNKLLQLKFSEAEAANAFKEQQSIHPITQACLSKFAYNNLYTKVEVKRILQEIYDSIGLTDKTAKASDIEKYMNVKEDWYSDNGKRNRGYRIL